MLTVVYDRDCALCRRLAEYGRARSAGAIEFVAWQALHETEEPPADLVAILDGVTCVGTDAWKRILHAYPPFAKLDWIAERLGLSDSTASAMHAGAAMARRLCRHCGHRAPRRGR